MNSKCFSALRAPLHFCLYFFGGGGGKLTPWGRPAGMPVKGGGGNYKGDLLRGSFNVLFNNIFLMIQKNLKMFFNISKKIFKKVLNF